MSSVVLDASAIVELLLDSPTGRRVHARVSAELLRAPVHGTVEVANALRGLVLAKKLSTRDGADCLTRLRQLRVRRHRSEVLLERIWQHRNHLNAYDAAYVVLAEALGATLVTCDAKLDTAQVRRTIAVEVIS